MVTRWDDGGPTFEDQMRFEGKDAAHGYRVVTRQLKTGNDMPITHINSRKINESDIPGLVAIATDGEHGVMPNDPQEVRHLTNYLIERYSVKK